jgi:hypothetical protein
MQIQSRKNADFTDFFPKGKTPPFPPQLQLFPKKITKIRAPHVFCPTALDAQVANNHSKSHNMEEEFLIHIWHSQI